ncbi:MAG: hypothetical protein IJS63_02380 [Bacteroidaceae bacterium]|nr:hypothetical protein [Bacteroidaceae bacterium]
MCYRNCFRGLLLLLASCFLSFFTSCQSGQDEVPAPEGQCTFTFSVTNYKQISFDDLSASATRAATSDPSTLDHLLVAVFDAETGQQACTSIQHDYENYKTKSAEYPLFYVTLPYGHYQVIVLGYNGQKACTISSPSHISWEENYVPNTFLYCEELTLNEDSEPSKDITLKHVVAAFQLTAEDAIPAELKKMRFISSEGGTVLNATTGYALENTGRTSDIEVPGSYKGKQGVPFTIYYFLPTEQTTSDFIVQALGVNDVVLNEKHFNDVPLRINYLTEWKGKLFEASDDEPDGEKRAFYIEWDTQWAGELHIDQ